MYSTTEKHAIIAIVYYPAITITAITLLLLKFNI